MSESKRLEKDVKLFKNGNSYAFRISKADREALNADSLTQFKKVVSKNGQEITFRKVAAERPNMLELANELFDEHEDLMKRLENL